MSEINILSPFVADLIAAGEVVDRPASVVKELIENAFDAGARTVTVEIRNGGATYIRVTDDGKGMAPEDAGIAFLRHATSKLSDERGLEQIGTFGFRGEALAAVSAVSRVEMTTRQKGAPGGVRMTLTAGEIQDMYETGCAEGTTMIIRDLFFNTPARLKFLKSDRAEGAACVQAAMKCALGRPDVSVRCIKDGKEEFFSPGDGKLESCVYHLLGREMAKSMIDCQPVEGTIKVEGFVSSPAEGRGNRTGQYFYVNGRAIKSQLIQKALEMAYRNRLLTGRFPYCVLHIEIPYGSVDVNVHPTKAEVKFSNEKAVYDAVYYTCLEAVGREDRLKQEAQQQAYWKENDAYFDEHGHYPAREPDPDLWKKPDPMEGIQYDENGRIIPTEDGRERVRYDIPLQLKRNNYMHDATAAPVQEFRAPIVPAKPVVAQSVPVQPQAQAEVTPEEQPAVAQTPAAMVPQPVPDTVQETVFAESAQLEQVRAEPFRVVGEVLNTYIIVEHGNQMTLIDKHAAHERIHFDRLSAGQAEAPSQMLLVPEVVRLDREDYQLVMEHIRSFEELGYEMEPFGDDAFMLRSVPGGIDPADGRACVEALCENLRAGNVVTYEQVRQELLKTVACKEAIKAGRSSQPAELEALAQAVLSGQVKYCPHGRPVSVTYTKARLDKEFDRIV